MGTKHPSIAPFAAFKTKDDYIVIAAGNDALFARVAKVLGHAEWAGDVRFAANPARVQHLDSLHAEMEAALAARSAKDWLALLQEEGVPCAPINDIAAVMCDPQVLARNMIVTADDPALGAVRMQGNPIKLSAHADPCSRPPAPDLDADRAAILDELLTDT
jgi:CoA:oxalate CoA-transferase